MFSKFISNSISTKHNWQSFNTASHYLIILYCLSAGLSIFTSQVFLAILVLFWISLFIKDKFVITNPFITKDVSTIWFALCVWILTFLFSACIGISPKDAIPESLKIAMTMQIPFVLCFCIRTTSETTVEKCRTYLYTLLISFSLAAVHTAISTGIAPNILPRTPGPITESGQLVLILPIVFALLSFSKNPKSYVTAGIIVFFSFILFSWPNIVPLQSTITQVITSGILLILLVFSISKKQKNLLYSVLLGLLFGALVVNLKRGPWIGVIAELLLLGILLSRTMFIATISGCGLLLLLEPARERILSLVDHFVIEGGRLDMWTIGVEMAARFPLGLGLDNAEYMRLLDPSMPATHRHMHNNFLNVAVETGWIGLAAYLWWLYLILKLSHKLWHNFSLIGEKSLAKLSLCIGISILGWQLSGMVEYNFGDTEIQLIALFLMGILFALSNLLESKLSKSLS